MLGVEMARGSDDAGRGNSKGRNTKQQLSGRQLSVARGGLVVGIATVVVVGVAGKLLSKLRKPKDLANNNSPYKTPTDALDKVIHKENPDMQINVDGPRNEILRNGKSCSALDLENAGSDHNDLSSASVAVDPLDVSAHSDLHAEFSPRIIIGRKLSPDQLHSDDSGLFIHEHSKEGKDSSAASETALSELLNHALLDAKHESPSKHELLSNTKALQDGIAGVISRAFEDFSYGDMSSDELTPTKVKLTISWETNSSSGSEEEHVQVNKEASLAENALLLPGSTKTEAEEHVIERINHDAQVSQDEEVAPGPVHDSSAPIEEQVSTSGDDLPTEEELRGTTNSEGKDTERGEPLQTAGNYVENNECTKPEGVPVFHQDKMERQSSTGVLHLKEIQEVVSLVDEVKKVLRLKEEIQAVVSLVDEVKKEKTFQESDHSQKHADHNHEAKISVELTSTLLRSSPNEITPAERENSAQIPTQVAEKEGTTMAVTKKETTSLECDGVQRHSDYNEEAQVSVNVTSNLLRITESSPVEITSGKDEDFIQISTQIAEHDAMTVAVTSLVLPASSREVTNITTIVAAKEHTITAGNQKADVVTNVEFTSTAKGLKREVEESWRGSWLSFEVLGLGLALIVALIAVLVWSIGARGISSVPRLY